MVEDNGEEQAVAGNTTFGFLHLLRMRKGNEERERKKERKNGRYVECEQRSLNTYLRRTDGTL